MLKPSEEPMMAQLEKKSFLGNLVAIFLSLFHRRSVEKLGAPLAWLWFDGLRVRRRVVLENLREVFPQWSEDQRLLVARRSMGRLCGNFFEVMLIPKIHEMGERFPFVLEGENHLREALAEKKGVLVLSLHLGNGDLGANLLQMHGYQVHLITKFFKSRWLNDLWFYFRRGQGVKLIEPHGVKTPFDILKALKKNDLVVFVNDQFMGKPFGVESSFFGRTTGTAFGLSVFYLKTKSPVLPIYSFYDETGVFHVRVEPPLNFVDLEGGLESSNENERIQARRAFVERLNKKLETLISQWPEQWMWVHRRWKKFE